jgi:hypothetical protein
MSTYNLTQSIPAEAGYDLVVAGGGPAGTAAAVCAARLGLKVLLAEATGCLGGMGTSGLVASFGPVSDGERMLVGGFMKELLETMWAQKAFGPQVVPEFLHAAQSLGALPSRAPEAHPRRLRGAGRRRGALLHAAWCEADVTGRRVNGVVLSNVEGLRYVPAKAFVDATGDAALAALAGAECKVVLRDTETVSPSTLCALLGGMNWDDPAYGDDWKGLDAVKAACAASWCPRRSRTASSRRRTASSPA